MENIPTAEEFFKKYSDNTSLSEGHYDYLVEKDSFKEAMIEFAKLHVEAFRKELKNNLELYSIFGGIQAIDQLGADRDLVTNSYPLTNIK